MHLPHMIFHGVAVVGHGRKRFGLLLVGGGREEVGFFFFLIWGKWEMGEGAAVDASIYVATFRV